MRVAQWFVSIALMVTGVGLGGYASLTDALRVTPLADRNGWAGADAVEEAAPLIAGKQPFEIVGPNGERVVQDNRKANVRFWEFSKDIFDGKHLPNYAQQTGDCVSFGAKNCLEYLQVGSAYQRKHNPLFNNQANRPPPKFRPVAPQYIYGYSRVIVGKRSLGRGAGSVGAWAAVGCEEGGVLALDEPGVPQYSGAVADNWGWNGPPGKFIEVAKNSLVGSTAKVTTADQVRDSICNGYPVSIASDFGTNTIRPRYGRLVARHDGKWFHQMCIIGYDGTQAEPLWYILNSWGPEAHGTPMQGEPPGGFWVTEEVVNYIVRQGDSFSWSQFDGFPRTEVDLDFNLSLQRRERGEAFRLGSLLASVLMGI